MKYRELGRTGWKVSEISFGAWAIGADWGEVDDKVSLAALERSIELGVNFIDTADVYGDGRSERLVAEVKRRHKDRIYVATKAGRRLKPHSADGYNRKNIEAFVDRSLKNLETEALDLLQLHCPPTEVYYRPDFFGELDDLVKSGQAAPLRRERREGRRGAEGDRVPQCADGADHLQHLPAAAGRAVLPGGASGARVGILARVPLASGLLTGKLQRGQPISRSTDHRLFNRHGESFDRGETFSGVDYETGLAAVEEVRKLMPEGMSMTQFALRWILMFDAVTARSRARRIRRRRRTTSRLRRNLP